MANSMSPIGTVTTPINQQYVGARYVPVFADPIEYNPEMTYEQLVIVNYLNQTYVSKKVVPPGNIPTYPSTEYWLALGNTNNQYNDVLQDIATLNSSVADVQNQADSTDSAVSALNTTVESNTKNITDTNTKIDDLNATLSNEIASVTALANSNSARLSDIDKSVVNYSYFVRSLTGIPSRKIIFISGSWGVYTDSFIDACASYMGLSSNYIKLAANGAGFTSGSFLSLLQSWAADNTQSLSDIGAIVVCASTNDYLTSSQPSFFNAINTLYDYITQTFPTALPYACSVGYANIAVRTDLSEQMMFNVNKALADSHFIFLNGVEYASHDLSSLDATGFHPNSSLSDFIGKHLSNAIQTGSTTVCKSIAENSVTSNGVLVSGRENIIGNVNYAKLIIRGTFSSPINVPQLTFTPILPDIKTKLSNTYYAYAICCETTSSASGELTLTPLDFRWDQSGVSVRSQSKNVTIASLTVNVDFSRPTLFQPIA